jgi:hypothetical protein
LALLIVDVSDHIQEEERMRKKDIQHVKQNDMKQGNILI